MRAAARRSKSAGRPQPASTTAPRTAPLDQLIRGLVVRGEGGTPTSFEVVETNGDRSLTRLLDANTARTFTDAERARLFELDTP